MPRKPRRDTWRQVNGKWTRSIGSRGTRIRIFEKRRGGVFFRDVWLSGRGKNRKSLGTTDRAEADRLGTHLLAALLRQEETTETVLLLRDLWERYSTESPAFLDNTPRTRKEEEAHVQVLIAFLGEGCDVRNLTEADAAAYTTKRLRGGIKLRSGEQSKAVRARSPEVELRILRTMLRWAATIRVRDGQRLLSTNPLSGLRGSREKNPKRPVASWERFQATRKAMRELAEKNVDNPARHQKWRRMEFALVLAEATGRRLGAIRHLV